MAFVFGAFDVVHHRRVAVKVIRPEVSSLVGTRRFLREIEIAAGLCHPHLIPVFDSGQAGDFLYYVMPFVEGESLRHRLDREKRISISEAVSLAREAADGLEHAHEHSVVHRDVKPENLLMSHGHVVVADLGLACAVHSSDAARREKLTETGFSVGSPVYMSPEQASGDIQVDARSDIYSLGCVLYEMLAGAPPFQGETALSVIMHRLAGPPKPLHDLNEKVPSSLEQAIQRALEVDPEDRFDSIAGFADALGGAPLALWA
jgi:serine/threonine-protein kinase